MGSYGFVLSCCQLLSVVDCWLVVVGGCWCCSTCFVNEEVVKLVSGVSLVLLWCSVGDNRKVGGSTNH